MKVHQQTLGEIFRWPLLIGAAALAGLVIALLGDGVWDWAGVVLLAPSVVALVPTMSGSFRRRTVRSKNTGHSGQSGQLRTAHASASPSSSASERGV